MFTTESTECAEGGSGREAKGPKKNEVVFLRPILVEVPEISGSFSAFSALSVFSVVRGSRASRL